MIKDDILGGLKSALTRGYSLEEAMLSFLNAGYKKKDIEEAAQALQALTLKSQVQLQPQPIFQNTKISQPKLKTEIPVEQVQIETPVSKPINVQKPVEKKVIVEEVQEVPAQQVVVSRVSAYTGNNARIKTITTILVLLLVLLLGILGLMYIFRNQIIAFFNNFFSNG
jgi:hypothetical protein